MTYWQSFFLKLGPFTVLQPCLQVILGKRWKQHFCLILCDVIQSLTVGPIWDDFEFSTVCHPVTEWIHVKWMLTQCTVALLDLPVWYLTVKLNVVKLLSHWLCDVPGILSCMHPGDNCLYRCEILSVANNNGIFLWWPISLPIPLA